MSFEMPTLKTAADAVTAMASLTNAVAAGELAPVEAADLSRLVTDFGCVIEVRELAERFARLEVAVPAATRS